MKSRSPYDPTASTSAPPSASETLIQEVEGLCAFESMAIQLQIHANDTMERKTIFQQFAMPAQLTVMLLLEGDVRVSINHTDYLMSARNGPVGYIWLLTKPGTLERHIKAGQRVRKVNVSVPLESVEKIQLPEALRQHICLDAQRTSVSTWSPSPHAMRCAQEILSQPAQQDSMHSLEAYIAGLCMLQQGLRLTQESPQLAASQAPSPVGDRDMARARRIRERILRAESIEITTPQLLAREFGMSVSTVQRLFKAAYGTSVTEFQRSERMKTAKTLLLEGGLTVGEVGYRAGYSTLSNFSSAFQRTFGYPPSACVRR